jgi:hypothetical protein
VLLGEQAEMAGDAQPFSIFEDPGVGETPAVLVVLAFVGSLFVGCAGNNDGVAVTVQFHVLRHFHGHLIGDISDISQELRFAKHRAVVIGEYKVCIQDFFHRAGIVMHLHLIPQIFERDDLEFVIGTLRTNCTWQKYQH